MENRVHAFEGVRNFRDFGAYEGAGGRKLKTGKLFRSAQFGEATESDLDRLDQLNIKVQADLRRPDERERHGHRWPVRGVDVLSSDKGRAKDAPHVRFLTQVEVNAAEAHQWMVEYYEAAPYKPQHVELFSAWFEKLSNLDDTHAAVVNCAAGKDRTGILCALTHHALGVDREAIFADYILTNEAADVEARLPEVARGFNEYIGKDHPADVYHPFIGVDEGFLDAAITSIEKTSGSLDRYLEDTLGIDQAGRARLRSQLLD